MPLPDSSAMIAEFNNSSSNNRNNSRSNYSDCDDSSNYSNNNSGSSSLGNSLPFVGHGRSYGSPGNPTPNPTPNRDICTSPKMRASADFTFSTYIAAANTLLGNAVGVSSLSPHLLETVKGLDCSDDLGSSSLLEVAGGKGGRSGKKRRNHPVTEGSSFYSPGSPPRSPTRNTNAAATNINSPMMPPIDVMLEKEAREGLLLLSPTKGKGT
jgi:hypothetical protein